MSNQADLDAAIAALPDQVTAAVVAAVKPLVGQSPDFDPEIANLNAIPNAVADAVKAQLAPPAP